MLSCISDISPGSQVSSLLDGLQFLSPHTPLCSRIFLPVADFRRRLRPELKRLLNSSSGLVIGLETVDEWESNDMFPVEEERFFPVSVLQLFTGEEGNLMEFVGEALAGNGLGFCDNLGTSAFDDNFPELAKQDAGMSGGKIKCEVAL